MDYIRAFDVELDRSVYYAGDMLTGHVYIEVEENMRLQNIKVFLRGKAHTEWKITRAGERRTMKQDEHYLDERLMIWGKDDNDCHQGIPILTRGRHRYPFHFQLPEMVLPCSFESKIGNIRYYVRVNLNIPYASCPQCIRYFTIIGPHIDCMDERFLAPVNSIAKKKSCSLCCGKGPMLLRTTLERTSYVCGEQIMLKAEVQNGGDSEAWVLCKLIQYVEFFINKGVLGLSKEVRHTVLEAESEKVPAHETSNLEELMAKLVIPIIPPTLVEVCGLIQIFYTLKIYLETSKGKGDAAEINMPITIATAPYKTQTNSLPEIHYEVAAANVEGGMYISPEFQLGQVYMGDEVDPETDQTILYRPVYVCVSGESLIPSKTDVHLLQVPTRQLNKSHENLQGSKEGLNIPETSNQAQHHLKMFQVPSDEACSSKGKKNIVEDKFLKEITAKLATRNIQERGTEEGAKHSSGIGEQQQEIDAHVEMMRKQKKSNDNVHKALVNELRKHLSEGDDSAEIEKVPRGLKKSGGLKKISDNVSDTNKVTNNYSFPDGQDEANVSFINDKPKQHVESPRRTQVVPTVQTFTKIYPKTVISVEQEEAEISEQTALLTDLGNTSSSVNNGQGFQISENFEQLSDIQTSLHESFHNEFATFHDEAKEDFMTALKHDNSALVKESSDFVPDLHGASELNIRLSHHSSTERTVNTIMPAAIAATVTAAAPAAAELSPVKQTPSVAPKPKHKDRHSFPAVFQSSEAAVEHLDYVSKNVARPKSEMVEQATYGDDSTA